MTNPATAPVCIIGGGSSGVAVAKALKQRGIGFDCFEAGSDIGGMWRYQNDNGLSSAYASLHIDTSRDNLGYSDVPIPRDLPDFLSHAQFLAYLEDYADRFDIRRHITFQTCVEAVTPAADGRWQVRLSDGRSPVYATVIVANGHLWDPRWPDLVVSGINHGYNLGTDIFYSGTVAAAREAALRGIPSMAFSLGPQGSFERAAEAAALLAAKMLEAPGTEEGERGALLNVNFPPQAPFGGVRATRLGRRVYLDEVDVRQDPRGKEYFWIGGPKAHHEPVDGSDTEAVDAGFISVTPLSIDATDADDLGLAAWVAGPGAGEGGE